MFMILSSILATTPFSAPNDPVLQTRAKELTKNEMFSEQTKALSQKMKEIGLKYKDSMAGLAAPQIGVSKRIIMINLKGQYKIYYNPQVIWKSRETSTHIEGCFSTGRIFGWVSRPSKIKLCAYDEKGALLVETFEGMTARIFQHEVDHLNGIRFISHIDDTANLDWVEENEMAKYRQSPETWHNKCTQNQIKSLFN